MHQAVTVMTTMQRQKHDSKAARQPQTPEAKWWKSASGVRTSPVPGPSCVRGLVLALLPCDVLPEGTRLPPVSMRKPVHSQAGWQHHPAVFLRQDKCSVAA